MVSVSVSATVPVMGATWDATTWRDGVPAVALSADVAVRKVMSFDLAVQHRCSSGGHVSLPIAPEGTDVLSAVVRLRRMEVAVGRPTAEHVGMNDDAAATATARSRLALLGHRSVQSIGQRYDLGRTQRLHLDLVP